MPNPQQPEIRRNGRDPVVQDSAEDRATGAGRERGPSSGRPVPEGQRSPYGPQAPANRRVTSGVEPEPDER